MSTHTVRSNSYGLLLAGATSSLAIAVSLYLWQNVKRLQLRIEELERKAKVSAQKERRASLSSRKEDANADELNRSISITAAPEPEVVLGPFDDLPLRFEKAGKGDLDESRRRFVATLEWRKENDMDTALYRAWPDFDLIKEHYPHFFHARGLNGEPVFYEQPPKTNLKALREGGVDMMGLLRHYAMICEFQW